jgi:hypothetical protein
LSISSLSTGLPKGAPASTRADDALWRRAQDLEAAFLAEMLGHAGLNGSTAAAEEGQFSSFLRTAQAEAIVAKGGVGLAQSIYDSLVAGRETDDSKPA